MRRAAIVLTLMASGTLAILAGPGEPAHVGAPLSAPRLADRVTGSDSTPLVNPRANHPANNAAQAPGVPAVGLVNPDVHIRLAAQFISTADDFQSPDGKFVRGHHLVNKEDFQYIRFLSFWNTTEARLWTDRIILNWWLQQMSFQQSVELAHEVPGSGSRLVWIDLRDYLWNAAAWQRVAERDFYLAEPWIDHEQTEFLRRKLAAPLSADALKGREIAAPGGLVAVQLILPAGSMVTASQFIRDTLESDRTPSYYDLLFARQRFLNVKLVPGESVVTGGTIKRTTRKTFQKTTTRKVPITSRGDEVRIPATGTFYQSGPGNSLVRLANNSPVPTGTTIYHENEHRVLSVYTVIATTPVRYKDEVTTEDVTEEITEDVPAPPRPILAQATLDFKFVNFPKNDVEWNSAFGIDKIVQFAQDQQIDLDFGAVVEGGLDNPKQGSMVATHNRLLVTVKGPFGANMRTFDVAETSGLKDYSESLIFAGKRFKKGQGAQAIFDAGELLSYLPNGGQAGLLVNAKGDRLETADNRFATDNGSTTMDHRVRNMGSCVVCHAPSGGYILPKDLIVEGWEKGIDAKFKDREQRSRVKAFFEGYLDEVKGFTGKYDALLARTTKHPQSLDKNDKGWNGARIAQEIETFRRVYDQSLSLATAAQEMGIPPTELKRLLAISPFNRAQQMLQGREVPRRTWEKDVYPNLQILRQAKTDEKPTQ